MLLYSVLPSTHKVQGFSTDYSLMWELGAAKCFDVAIGPPPPPRTQTVPSNVPRILLGENILYTTHFNCKNL